MKKILMTLAIAASVVALVSCGGNTKEDEKKKAETEQTCEGDGCCEQKEGDCCEQKEGCTGECECVEGECEKGEDCCKNK